MPKYSKPSIAFYVILSSTNCCYLLHIFLSNMVLRRRKRHFSIWYSYKTIYSSKNCPFKPSFPNLIDHNSQRGMIRSITFFPECYEMMSRMMTCALIILWQSCENCNPFQTNGGGWQQIPQLSFDNRRHDAHKIYHNVTFFPLMLSQQ